MGVNPQIRRRHDAMREAAAVLAEAGATAPPPDVRATLLRAALSTIRPHDVAPSTPTAVFEHQVAALREVLVSLDPGDWGRIAAPYSWSIHALVAHLLVIERYTARQLGLRLDLDYRDDEHHLAVGGDEILAEVARSPHDTVESWHEHAMATVDALRAGRVDLDAPVTFHSWPFSGSAVLIARGFEVWTHADDIRRACGRPTVEPAAADLRAMSTFSVGSLPLLLPVVAPNVPMAPARIVLTGPGGGTFRLGGAVESIDGDDASVTVVADVVDYCRVASRRIDPQDLDTQVIGDRELADALLGAVRTFAV